MATLDRFAAEKLAELDARHLRRTLVATGCEGIWAVRDGRRFLSFSSNDYLNLTQHPAVKAAAVAAIERWGAGAGASRLVTGNHPLYEELESRLARLKGTESALVFGSGYLANAGIIPTLAGSDDLVLLDELSHACLHAGAQLARGRTLVFRHNDVAQAADLLATHRRHHPHAIIATDGVFSMDGDRAPLAALAALAEAHDAWLLADDAHGLGVIDGGRGSAAAAGATVPLQMGTLSKAVGSYGGYLCASRPVIALMATRARTLVYSTGLPPATVAASIAALDIIASDPALVAQPLAKAQAFTRAAGLPLAASAIVPVLLGSEERALAASALLAEAGFLVAAIRPPTVPPGTARLRIAFTAGHLDDAVARLAAILRDRILTPRGTMSAVFLTATGTDIGKTFVACGLIRELTQRGRTVAAVKPLVSGYEDWSAPASDPARLLAALDIAATDDEVARIAPFRFRAPLAPDRAAEREGRHVDFAALVKFCRGAEDACDGTLIIEGIGGVMVPVDARHTVLDLMAELRHPALLVVGSYLGTISHTLTALAVLRQRRVTVAAIVVSETPASSVPLADQVASIAPFAGTVPVLALPRLAPGAGHAVFGTLADLL